jgi:hypothetical protein
MKKITTNKKHWYWALFASACAAVFAIAVIVSFMGLPHHLAQAQTSGIPNISLNTTGDGSGNIKGVSVSMSSSGPFTENFQVAVCFQQQGRDNNRIDCVHTPWAASSSDAGVGQWSAFSASPEQTIDGHWTTTNVSPNGRVDNWETLPTSGGEPNGCGLPGASNCSTCYDSKTCTGSGYYYDYGTGWQEISPSLFVRTAPLPAGEVIDNVQLGFKQVDVNGDDDMWNAISSGQDFESCAEVYTPMGGGTSAISYGYVYGNCVPGNIDTGGAQDYFSIYMNANLYNAAAISNNIPNAFAVSGSTTTGTGGGPLEITMQNTGNPWVSSNNTASVVPGTAKGTDCSQPSGSSYICPAWNDSTGSYCTTEVDNHSATVSLHHVSGSFAVDTDPAPYNVTTTNTCTITSAGSCSNNLLACDSESACVSQDILCVDSNGAELSDCGSGSPSEECTMDCAVANGQLTGCGGTWNDYSYSQTPSPSVPNGADVVFPLGSLTAPGAAGTYNETWQMEESGKPFGTPFTIPITVGSPSPSVGTITVTSENAANPSTLVNASWDLTGPVDNSVDGIVCSATGALGLGKTVTWENSLCSGSSATYQGVPADSSNYTIPDATTTVPEYSLRSVQQVPIAEKKNDGALSSLQLSLKNIFSTVALAQSIGTIGGNGFSPNGSATLTPAIPSAAFVILWTPNADMQVSPGSVSLASGAPSGSVTVQNTGAPYSTLTWTATASTTDSGNWLSVTPGGTIQNGGSGGTSGATNAATVSYAGGLAAGNYNGTITFTGQNKSNAYAAPIPTQTVSVSLTVGNPPGGAGYSCVSNACSAVTSGAQYASLSSCNAACGSTTPTSTPPGGSTTTPSLPACTPGVNCPVCSPALTASPASVVVPESSGLSYSCKNVTECQLVQQGTGQMLQDVGAGSSGTIDTTANPYAVSPTNTTAYTLACVNSSYAQNANNPVSSSATVTVSGSSYCEQNPNGVGCQ